MKPWLKKEWCIPPEASAEFVCQMEEVLSVYQRPYDARFPVVCMDETSKQLIGETRTPLPLEPGKPERYDSEYERNGVQNIFLGFEPLKGLCIVQVTERRTAVDWAHYMRFVIDEHYPDAERIVLVVDNLNTHKKASFYEVFPAPEAKRLADKLEIHYTPKHGSWLDMAEIELSILSRQCLNRRIATREELQQEVKAWQDTHNSQQKQIHWRFDVENARCKLKRLYPSF
jgi:hypothetical protein